MEQTTYTDFFRRDLFYNIGDVTKKFKISSAAYHKLLKDQNIPTLKRLINHGAYHTTAIYAAKDVIDALKLPLR